MTWTQVVVLSLLATVFVLTACRGAEGAAVKDGAKTAEEPHGHGRKVFMPASEASNFFGRRNRRSTSHAEYIAEQRVIMQRNEWLKEYNDEQRDEYENYAEEDRDEQNERTREKNEQWREYSYDGGYPRFYWS